MGPSTSSFQGKPVVSVDDSLWKLVSREKKAGEAS